MLIDLILVIHFPCPIVKFEPTTKNCYYEKLKLLKPANLIIYMLQITANSLIWLVESLNWLNEQ